MITNIKLNPVKISIAVLVFFTVMGTAAADEWVMFQHDLENTGETQDVIETPQYLGVKWKVNLTNELGNPSGVSSPSVSGNYVYVGSNDGMYCLDKNTGNIKWSAKIRDLLNSSGAPDFPVFGSGVVVSTPAISGDYIYFGTLAGYIYCLDKDNGNVVWNFKTEDMVKSAPAVSGDYVYIGSGDSYIYCINKDTGELVWKFKTGGGMSSSPAISGDYVYIGSDDGYVYCINKNAGKLIWKFKTGGAVHSSPAISGNYVYIGSDDGYVYCINKNAGELVWKFKTGGSVKSSPAISGNYVYTGSTGWYIYCLDKNTGKEIWNFRTGEGGGSTPTVSGDYVYAGSLDSHIYCLDKNTGELAYEFKTNYPVTSPLAISGENVYLNSFDGEVYAFEVSTAPAAQNNYSIFFAAIIIILIIFILIYFLKIKKPLEEKAFDISDFYEDDNAEFKSSLRWDYKEKRINKELEYSAARTLAGFMNSEGGILFIGVDDSRRIVGLVMDYGTLRKGKRNRDGFELQLTEIINNYIGPEYRKFVKVSFKELQGKEICYIKTGKSPKPAFIEKDGSAEFVIRSGNRTQVLDVKRATEYIGIHWKE